VSVVNQAVEDGIGDGGIADVSMPVFDRELAGHECGAGAVAVFDDFQKVSSFWVVALGDILKVLKSVEISDALHNCSFFREGSVILILHAKMITN